MRLVELVEPEELLASAPVVYSPFRDLLAEYADVKTGLEAVAGFLDGKESLLQIFLDGNVEEGGHRRATRDAKRLLGLEGAISALDSRFWTRALDVAGLKDTLPAKRRAEWVEMINAQTCPRFEETTLIETIRYLVDMQGRFLSERVDGIFQALSRSHLTNEPQGFGRRMILPCCYSEHGGYPEWRMVDVITDLRRVIATFMGRDEPDRNTTNTAMKRALSLQGAWCSVDGGALRIRAYRGVRTAHLEVHESLAWRLNALLANLHPSAIPEAHRTPPKRKPKGNWGRIERPLPNAVLGILAGLSYSRGRNAWTLPTGVTPKEIAALDEARALLEGIGATSLDRWSVSFPYEPAEVIEEIVSSGLVPDHVSHQYYPTPKALAERLIAIAEIPAGATCLEPSAGQGAIADLLPRDDTLCIEVAPLHAKLLEAKGHRVLCADFLKWSQGEGCHQRFERVVMNPPFRDGQAVAHVEVAWQHVAPGGRLVAIVPEGAMRALRLADAAVTWSDPIEGAFPGVSVRVRVLVAKRVALAALGR